MAEAVAEEEVDADAGALEEAAAMLGQPLELQPEPGLAWGAESLHAR